MSDTRWSSRAIAVDTFIKVVFETLNHLTDLGDGKAQPLCTAMTTSDFLVTITIVDRLLGYSLGLSKPLQLVDSNLLKAVSEAKLIIEAVEAQRNEERFAVLYERAEKLAELADVEICMPRVVRRSTRSNAPSCTPQQYYYRNVFLSISRSLLTRVKYTPML